MWWCQDAVKEKNSDTLEEVQQREKTESVEVSDETENKADETEQTVDTEPVKKAGSEGVIYVFVCGQVASPGVYELPEGSRICQAIDAAGGMLDTASMDWVNQAETAEDGQKIYVPSTEEAETMPEGHQTGQMQETSSAEGTDGKSASECGNQGRTYDSDRNRREESRRLSDTGNLMAVFICR